MADSASPPILDYEGSDYRTRFWEGQGRDYEDRAERIAIQRLLPPMGKRIIEVGAGFGRLTSMYAGYEQVVLFDYSRSQLEFAREQYGDDGYLYVAGNVYQMPFAPKVFDTAIMVRVLHHMQDAPAALRSIRNTLQTGSIFVLEYASKQHLKSIARWLLRRQSWSPFSLEPVEFVELNFDFHPRYIQQKLQEEDFQPGRRLTVSHFRMELLKRIIPTGILVAADSMAQLTGDLWQLAPSVFVRSEAVGEDLPAAPDSFWRCPACGSIEMAETAEGVTCQTHGHFYPIRNGIYDFKEAEQAAS
jgi:SAM-dependent methyltransferase